MFHVKFYMRLRLKSTSYPKEYYHENMIVKLKFSRKFYDDFCYENIYEDSVWLFIWKFTICMNVYAKYMIENFMCMSL